MNKETKNKLLKGGLSNLDILTIEEYERPSHAKKTTLNSAIIESLICGLLLGVLVLLITLLIIIL